MRLDYLARHLLSGAAVYVIVAACSASDDNKNTAASGGHGGATSDGPGSQDALHEGQGLDALADTGADVLDAITDPVRDATAQEGGCGTCTIAGPVKTITADSDVNQLIGGRADVPSCPDANAPTAVELAVGPFVLTDVRPISSGTAVLYTVAESEACTPYPSGLGSWVAQFVAPNGENASGFTALSGGRLLIPAGRKLCGRAGGCAFGGGSPADVYWSGFRPYT